MAKHRPKPEEQTRERAFLDEGQSGFHFSFPFSQAAADRFDLAPLPAPGSGPAASLDLAAVRALAHRMNLDPKSTSFVRPGDLCAMGLLGHVLGMVCTLYMRHRSPGVLDRAWVFLEDRVGPAALQASVEAFLRAYPPPDVLAGRVSVADHLGSVPAHRLLTLEWMILVQVARTNPALEPFAVLFGPPQEAFAPLVEALETFFEGEPGFGPDDEPLPRLLAAPARFAPGSLAEQLVYIRTHWRGILPEDFSARLLRGLDLLAEERVRYRPGPGPATPPLPPGLVAGQAMADEESEAFSPDLDWMPRVVLAAKNVHVWLHQLSRAYGRSIERVDQIPDQELDRLARWGFTGLWLIGIWERSPASGEIKRRMGNPEASASAYAIWDYRIAADLGGEEALARLSDRARARGIRLAGDMVPNHMGLDSRWVVQHPGHFLSRPDSPFPWYSFTGPDLCSDENVTVQIEDRYWTREDAAVVFKRMDRRTGEVAYVYHGNDGTGMPWNDTAQLDFLDPEVRAAVLRSVLGVARLFPIIRFDAAMTLTRRHFRRLWYPPPGEGGAVPTRAESGTDGAAFDAGFPMEFWREVVDAVAEQAPETLLLAEAFWLMEGYFVRTLGMHRVYNSAFMNMLSNEENERYRTVIREVLDFDPRILCRFVNFQSNPDEKTAAEEFGTGDKYFGVTTLLATLPGLPLFGHGQIEGFREKYGMEYGRDYWGEEPDQELVERHEREIFPLLRRRALFSGVDHFTLFDFQRPDGTVDENVFAFANRHGDERALVVYHNRFAETQGRIAGPMLRTLGLGKEDGLFIALRDLVSGLVRLVPSVHLAEEGLSLRLRAYDRRVFLSFDEIRGERVERLYRFLGDRAFSDLSQADKEMGEAAARGSMAAALSPTSLSELFRDPPGAKTGSFVQNLQQASKEWRDLGLPLPPGTWADPVDLAGRLDRATPPFLQAVMAGALVMLVHGRMGAEEPLDLTGLLAPFLDRLDLPDQGARAALLAGIIVQSQAWQENHEIPLDLGLASLLPKPEVQVFLGCNVHEDVRWFSCEALLALLQGLEAAWMTSDNAETLAISQKAQKLAALAQEKEYRFEDFCKALDDPSACSP